MGRSPVVPPVLRPLRVVGAVGSITRLYALAFVVPLLASLAYDPAQTRVAGVTVPRDALVFVASGLTTYLVGEFLRFGARRVAHEDLADREAYLTVGIGWMVLVVLSGLPFLLSGTLTSPIDAFFEAMSGITTTGSTVIGDLEAVSPSVHIWRALMQYIGGMGIIVLSVAVLARLTQGGIQLLQAEAPGPSVTRLRPRLAQTAKSLWGIYLLFTVVLFVILLGLLLGDGFGAKEAFYEALLHTFTTIATGGFSNHSTSMAYFDSWIFEAVVILFMLISGTNFTLHYHALRGDWRQLVRDAEFRFYISTVVLGTLAVTGILVRAGMDAVEALRGSAFSVASLATSSGFGTADFDAWHPAAKLLLLLIMVTGGAAGSTSGGMKHVRILILFKIVRRELMKLVHPKAVVPVRLGGKVLQEGTLLAVVAFFFSYVALMMLGTLILATTDPLLGAVDAAGASISALSNMGPALGVVGPTRNYAELLPSSKALLALWMWFGRLEIFTALILFSPESWKN